MARACGSYPQCPRFESRCRYQIKAQQSCAFLIRPVGQAVKTPPFHGGNMGSIPVRVTKKQSTFVGCFFTYRCANRGEIVCFKVKTAAANVNVYTTKLDCLVLE